MGEQRGTPISLRAVDEVVQAAHARAAQQHGALVRGAALLGLHDPGRLLCGFDLDQTAGHTMPPGASSATEGDPMSTLSVWRIDTPGCAENAVSTLGELSQHQLITALAAPTVSCWLGRPQWEART
ncbi:hypothetical protein [Geodermatophilus amargosae]|uniref:hypothetical protein n=1 Tax=Geodermatophilus amargosae TaxID=1296565 RepID=UPI0034DF2396